MISSINPYISATPLLNHTLQTKQPAFSDTIIMLMSELLQRLIQTQFQPQNTSQYDWNPSPSHGTSNGQGEGNEHGDRRNGRGGDNFLATTPETSDHSDKSAHSTVTGSGPVGSGRTINVNSPIVVHKGEVFDGHNNLYVGGSGIGNGSQSEHQQPMFVVEQGGTLQNVRMSGGGDGIHLLGDATLKNVHNLNVSEDAITIDGPGNREHDSRISGTPASGLPARPKIEILDSSFDNASDKVIQDNQAADVLLRNVSVNGAGKVFRTNGGHTDIDSHVTVEDSTLKGIKEAVFRTDAPGAHVSLHGVRDDAPHQVEALSPSQADGARSVSRKEYTG
ncbi:pectate lyase [Xanthomonas axonopodis pv. fascicularis]|uniref:pectate lyase n=1 Tax=Xanthomonas axonopodis TaxID=53413 RepID=UPI0035312BC8